jgi:hypothetical protein
MKLLTFAHRGEAQAFLADENFKPVEFIFDGLLKSESHYLLITGEGTQSASEKTIATLTRFGEEISEVINLGVAGSLSNKIKKFDLVWVRTAYAHHAERLEFKSFTSLSEKTSVDCMSAFTRVLNYEEKTKLALFADLVDRELWAIASAAHLFKKGFRALKIVSDDLSASGADICQFVKEEAPLYSEKLLEEYKNRPPVIARKDKKTAEGLRLDSDFYFTVSQERKLQATLEGLRLLGTTEEKLLKDPFITSLKEQEILPKERTRLLLQYLTEKLSPVSKKIRESIEEALGPLKDARIQATFDNDFEDDWLNLSFRIQSTRDLERVKNALKIFSYEDFKKIFDGHFDV